MKAKMSFLLLSFSFYRFIILFYYFCEFQEWGVCCVLVEVIFSPNSPIIIFSLSSGRCINSMGTTSSSNITKKKSMASTGPCILVTGGCGYIGSHTITCLLQSPLNYSVVVVDNLSNSSSTSLDRVAEICELDDKSRKERLVFHNVDMCDKDAFRKVFEVSPQFDACIHFAGLKVRYKICRK